MLTEEEAVACARALVERESVDIVGIESVRFWPDWESSMGPDWGKVMAYWMVTFVVQLRGTRKIRHSKRRVTVDARTGEAEEFRTL